MPIREDVRRKAAELIDADGSRVGPRLASALGVSSQVANGYLRTLVEEGVIEPIGETRARAYRLRSLRSNEQSFSIDGLEEHLVVREVVDPQINDLPANVRDIWHYGASEMINNAIDHSGSPVVHVAVEQNLLLTEVTVRDEGEGIFRRIQRALALADPHQAILELVKGKLTTDPARHTGEGIFFTSRAMDEFEIESGDLLFRHRARAVDRLEDRPATSPGTTVRMQLCNWSERTLEDVFAAHTDSEDLTFDNTVVPLQLARHGSEALVSRSQARRIAHRFDKFKRVELDFEGINTVGQAFADEIFRVFATAHPETRVVPVNCRPAVERMVRRAAKSAAKEED